MVTRPDPAMDTLGDGLGSRVVAFGIDAVAVGAAWAVLWAGGTAVRAAVDGGLSLVAGEVTPVGVAVWVVAWVLVTGVAGLYFAAGHAVAGQSVGKRMADLVVVGAGGEPCGWGAATRRTAVLLAPAPAVATLDLLWGLHGAAAGAGLVAAWLAVELLVATVDGHNRRLGDRLAGTVVVAEAMAAIA